MTKRYYGLVDKKSQIPTHKSEDKEKLLKKTINDDQEIVEFNCEEKDFPLVRKADKAKSIDWL